MVCWLLVMLKNPCLTTLDVGVDHSFIEEGVTTPLLEGGYHPLRRGLPLFYWRGVTTPLGGGLPLLYWRGVTTPFWGGGGLLLPLEGVITPSIKPLPL